MALLEQAENDFGFVATIMMRRWHELPELANCAPLPIASYRELAGSELLLRPGAFDNRVLIQCDVAEFLVGPLFKTGRHPCPSCFRRRMQSRSLARHATNLPWAVFKARSARDVRTNGDIGSLAARAAAYVAQHYQTILQSLPGSIFQFDGDCADVREQVLIPDPFCCCVAGVIETASHLSTTGDQRNGDRSISISGEHSEYRPPTTDHLDRLAGDLVGIVGNVIETQVLPQLYISVGSVAPPLPQCLTAIVAEGRGATAGQARVTCLGEAAERYSCFFRGGEKRVVSSYSKLRGTAIHPNELMLFSKGQFGRSERGEMYAGAAALVPQEFDASAEIEWTEAASGHNCERVFIPTSYCYFGYSNPNHPTFCFPDSNGCAAGSTLGEAKMSALLELIERDACAIWWYNRIVRPNIDLRSLPTDPVLDWLAAFRSGGRSLTILDITSDLCIPVFAALSASASGADVRVGLGCHVEASTAAVRAVSELVQHMWGTTWDQQQRQLQGGYFGDPRSEWDKLVELSNSPQLNPAASYPIDEVKGGLPEAEVSIECANHELLRRLNNAGLEAYFVDLTRGDIQVPCVRAVVPGLRHFGRRLAPGRLYDVPVRMRWLSQPLSENDMNPAGFILAR